MYHTVCALFPWSIHVEDTSPSKALEPSSAGALVTYMKYYSRFPHTPHFSSLNAEETQEMAQCAPSIQA